jgi:hypothetical protein
MAVTAASAASPPVLTLSLGAPAEVVLDRAGGTPAWAVTWSLHNGGGVPLRVASQVLAAPRPQFDELTLRLCRDGASACTEVPLQTARAASVPVQCVLLPGAVLRHVIDLKAWFADAGVVLVPGGYSLLLSYRRQATGDGPEAPSVASCTPDDGSAAQRWRLPLWLGELHADPVRVMVRPPGGS